MTDRFGSINESLVYSRLPYYAALLQPLGSLGYGQAALIWFLYRMAAFAGFLALTTQPSRFDTLAFSAFYVPLFAAFAGGQDSIVVLFFVTLALHWERKGKDFVAGVAFSLCAIKPHLLVLLPLLLLLHRRRAVAVGLGVGATAILVLSTVAAGPQWPFQFVELIAGDSLHPAITNMPNLNGLLIGLPYDKCLLVVASIGVVVLCGLALPHVSFRLGVGIVLLGSLLICYHSFLTDCIILLPLFLNVLTGTKRRWLKWLTLAVLTPPLALLSTAPRPYSYCLQIALVVYLCSVVYDALRSAREEREPTGVARRGPAFG